MVKYATEKHRKDEASMKLRQAEEKMVLQVDFSKSLEDEKTAFDKLTAAAKAYDKNNPGAMSLEAFDCAYMEAGMNILTRVMTINSLN